jgi:hypothetical protein
LDSHGASEYNKESLQIPFINGAPGIGKTRMALETLNILKECALSAKANDPTERSLKSVLNTDNCVMLYTSFGNGFSLTNNDDLFWQQSDCSGVVTLRALWKSYLLPKHNIRLDQVPVTQAMAQYLTLDALVDRLRELGVQYIVLAIDEMNMLHDTNFNNFRKTIMSLGNVMLRHFKDLFVVFAGTIHTPLKKVITASLGIAVSISPSLFSLTDIEHILNDSVARFPYLNGWHRAGNFRRCVADLSNPPRVFDFLMVEINKQIKKNSSKDIFTLQYDAFMCTVIDKVDDKISNDIDPLTAKFLINCCLTKKVLRFNSALPKGKTIEEVTREGYAYIENSSSSLDVQLSVPFFNLFTWLKLDASVFGCAEHLFKFAWNDTNAIGPLAWEKFNVKYTSFKMTLLRDDESRTIPLQTFHSGAMFGADCAKCSVQPRFTVPVSHIDQFPASFDGTMETDGLTALVPISNRPTKLFDAVCLNGKNTTGIDAFYWLSENVVEFQQYKANEIDSKNPTKLTQAELDGEYAKAKNLFDKYLAKFNYQFVFGLVSNRIAEAGLTLQPNMYVVHQGNMEQYYGPLAGVAQIKSFTSVNVNTDDIPQLMKISGISQTKAEEIVKLRAKENFKNMQDLRERVKGVFENQASLLIEF